MSPVERSDEDRFLSHSLHFHLLWSLVILQISDLLEPLFIQGVQLKSGLGYNTTEYQVWTTVFILNCFKVSITAPHLASNSSGFLSISISWAAVMTDSSHLVKNNFQSRSVFTTQPTWKHTTTVWKTKYMISFLFMITIQATRKSNFKFIWAAVQKTAANIAGYLPIKTELFEVGILNSQSMVTELVVTASPTAFLALHI